MLKLNADHQRENRKMKKKMTALLAGALLSVAFASNAMAAFTDLSLERFVYGSTNEVATDLGNVNSLLGTTNNTIGAGSANFLSVGAGTAPLYASYFGFDST